MRLEIQFGLRPPHKFFCEIMQRQPNITMTNDIPSARG